MLSVIIGCLELLVAASHVMLGCLGVVQVGTPSHMDLDHFFDLRVVESLADLVNLDFDEFGGIVILVLGRHPLSFLKLSDMKAEVPHPVNVFFDFLSIVKALLKHSFLFDLFKDPKLGHDFRVHAATFKIGRLGNLGRSLSLLTA